MTVSRYHADICVELMGGEPTLLKNLRSIISIIRSIPTVKSIRLYTNLTQRIDIDFLRNIEVLATAHMNEMTSSHMQSFIDNVKVLADNGIPHCIKVIGFNKDYIDQLDDANISYSKVSIYDDHESYNGDIIDDAKFILNGQILTAAEIINGGLNHFKGWSCYINSVYVNSQGLAMRHCYGPRCHYSAPQFAQLLSMPVICNYDMCSVACKLEYIKIREQSSGILELRPMSTLRMGIS